MKYFKITLFSLFIFFSPSAIAQYWLSVENEKLMEELNLSIAPFYVDFITDNFSFGYPAVEETESNPYGYQLSVKHENLPIHFTVNFRPNRSVNVYDRVRLISSELGMEGDEIHLFTEINKKNYAADEGALLNGYNRNTGEDEYEAIYIFVMKSEYGSFEMVMLYDAEGNMENEEFKQAMDFVLTSFKFNEPLIIKDNFSGIGIRFQLSSKYNKYQIIDIVKGGVADKAGLLPGDIINKVNGKSAFYYDMSRVVNVLRGENNTTIKIGIKRGSLYYNFEMTRAPLDLNTDYEFISSYDIDLQKIYFLNTTRYLLSSESVKSNIGDFLKITSNGDKYEFNFEFPTDIKGTIVPNDGDLKTEIEYVLDLSEDREIIEESFNKYKEYLKLEYVIDFSNLTYTTEVGEGYISIVKYYMDNNGKYPDEIYATLSIEEQGVTYILKYVFYK